MYSNASIANQLNWMETRLLHHSLPDGKPLTGPLCYIYTCLTMTTFRTEWSCFSASSLCSAFWLWSTCTLHKYCCNTFICSSWKLLAYTNNLTSVVSLFRSVLCLPLSLSLSLCVTPLHLLQPNHGNMIIWSRQNSHLILYADSYWGELAWCAIPNNHFSSGYLITCTLSLFVVIRLQQVKLKENICRCVVGTQTNESIITKNYEKRKPFLSKQIFFFTVNRQK